jgi:hypothetical protein
MLRINTTYMLAINELEEARKNIGTAVDAEFARRKKLITDLAECESVIDSYHMTMNSISAAISALSSTPDEKPSTLHTRIY